MMNNIEEEQVEAMAAALEEQLSIVYPRGPHFSNDCNNEGDDNNEKMTTEDEGTLRNSFQNLIQDLNYSADYQQLKVAFARAAHRWKSISISNGSDQMTDVIPSPQKTSTTFSLFDQLQGGFALPVTLEEIQEASSAQERFKVLEKIDYVDDLLMDWKEICHILTTDLFDSSQATDPELALQIISLHRKWFDQGRSSEEYTPLLYSICQNLLETLGTIIKVEENNLKKQNNNRESQGLLSSSENIDETVVVSLVQNWRDMWLDLMQRNQYSEDLVQDMESCMFMIYLRNAPSKKSALAQKVLALVDPNARWFQSWMNHVATIDHIISLLCMEERDSMILSELWIRIQTFPEEDNNNKNPSNYAFQLHSISILSITLCRTRLSHFPWDVINQKRNVTCTENFTTIIDEMLDLFLHVVVSLSMLANSNTTLTNNDFSNELKITILNGVEAILEGSRCDNNSDFERRFGNVRSILQQEAITGDKTITRFLNIYNI